MTFPPFPAESRRDWSALLEEQTYDVMLAVANERSRQVKRWGVEHDDHHEGFEWLGLIARYAAEGDYVKAAAVAVAAREAQIRAYRKELAAGDVKP